MNSDLDNILKKYYKNVSGGARPKKNSTKKKAALKTVFIQLYDINDRYVTFRNYYGTEYYTEYNTLNLAIFGNDISSSDEEVDGGRRSLYIQIIDVTDELVIFKASNKNTVYKAIKEEVKTALKAYKKGEFNLKANTKSFKANSKKFKEGAPKRKQSAKQKEWMDFVNALGKKEEFSKLSRKELLKKASQIRKSVV